MIFKTNATYPFIVALKNQKSDSKELIPFTGVAFENPISDLSCDWAEFVEKNPICHPLAIIALIKSQWSKFKAEIAQILEIEEDDAKINTLGDLLANEIPYFLQSGDKRVKTSIPLCLFSPEVKDNKFTFYMRLEMSNVSHPHTFPLEMLAQYLIENQEWLLNDLQLLYEPNVAPSITLDIPRYNFVLKEETPSPFSMLKNVLAGPLDQERVGYALENGPAPEFYKILWLAIGTDPSIPGLLRHKILIDLYNKIIKDILTDEQQKCVREILETPDWADAENRYYHPHTFVPDHCNVQLADNAKKIKPKSVTDHVAEMVSREGPSISALDALTNYVRPNKKNISDYLTSLYEKITAPQQSAIMIYFIERALYRSVLACLGTGGIERSYLLAYAETLRCALNDMEIALAKGFYDQASCKTEVVDTRMIAESADSSMRMLEHSPFAWQDLLGYFKIDILLQNFAQGYQLHSNMQFTVQEVNRIKGTPDQFEVKYSCGSMSSYFKIVSSTLIEKRLREKTQETYCAFPLTERVTKIHEAMEPEAQTESARLQMALMKGLSTLERSNHPPELEKLLRKFKALIQPPMPSLLPREKKNLFAYALYSAATDDTELVTPVANVFRELVSFFPKNGVYLIEEIYPMLQRFQRTHARPTENIDDKVAMLIAFQTVGVRPNGFRGEDLAPALATEEAWKAFIKMADLPAQDIDTLEQTHLRSMARFIRDNYSYTENSFFDKEFDIFAMGMVCGGVNLEIDPTLSMLEKTAADLLYALKPGIIGAVYSLVSYEPIPQEAKDEIWLAAVMLRALSQAEIYNPYQTSEHKSLDKLTLLSIADAIISEIAELVTQHLGNGHMGNGDLLREIRETIKKELKLLEADALRESVIPCYHAHYDEKYVPVKQTVSVPAKKIKKRTPYIAPPPPPVAPPTTKEESSSPQGMMAAMSQKISKLVKNEVPMLPQTQVSPQPSPQAVSAPQAQNYKASNKLKLQSIIESRLAEFIPASTHTATPYYDPTVAVNVWLELQKDEQQLDSGDLPALVLGERNDSGPQALIDQYWVIENEIRKWAASHSMIIDGEKEFGSIRNLLTEIVVSRQAFESAIINELTVPVMSYVVCHRSNHDSEMSVTLIESSAKAAQAKLNNQLLRLSNTTNRLRTQFEQQKTALEELKAKRDKEHNADVQLFQDFVKNNNSGLLEKLERFEKDLLAKIKVEETTNMFAKILAGHEITESGSHADNCRKLRDQLYCSVMLRAALSAASRARCPALTFVEQHEGLKTKREALRIKRDALTLWKPWHWKQIFTLFIEAWPMDKELSYFEKAQTAANLKSGFRDLLVAYSNKSKKEDTQYLLWTAQKNQDETCAQAYVNATQSPDQIGRCHDATDAFKKSLGSAPSPVAELFEAYHKAVTPKEVTPIEKQTFFTRIIQGSAPASPVSGATHSLHQFSQRSNSDIDLSSDELQERLNNGQSSATQGNQNERRVHF